MRLAEGFERGDARVDARPPSSGTRGQRRGAIAFPGAIATLLLPAAFGVLGALGVDGPDSAAPQGPRLDVGSFTLFVSGQRTGREQFSLQSIASADGGIYELRAESAIGDRRSAVRLETDSAGTPVRYAVEERAGAVVALRLGGQRIRGRFATIARSTRGEASREYILAPGALVLEEEGVHQYAMLVRSRRMQAGDTVAVPTLTPIQNRQGVVRLVLVSPADTVTIAGSRRDAWCWRVLTSTGEIRTVWADAEGRVLRVRIPSRGFEAIRDDVPR